MESSLLFILILSLFVNCVESVPKTKPSSLQKSKKMMFGATTDFTDIYRFLKRRVFHQIRLFESSTPTKAYYYTTQIQLQDQIDGFNNRLQQALDDITNVITNQSKIHSSEIKDIEDQFEQRLTDLSTAVSESSDEINKLETAIPVLKSTIPLLEDKLTSLSSTIEVLSHINFNVAQFKPAALSSISGINREPSKGVNEDVNTYFQTANTQGKKHWIVDLQHNFEVARVELENLPIKGNRLVNVDVSVGLSRTNMTVIGHFKGPGTNHQVITFKLDPPVSSRYVQVESTSNEVLHLGEVRVFRK